MLVKLVKYDMKRLGNTIIPEYLFLALFAVLDRILHFLQKSGMFSKIEAMEYVTNLTQFCLILGVFCLFIVVLVFGIHYYKNNMMQDEGYLMHTLPVSTHQLLASKMISFLLWIICTIFCAYLVLAFDFGNLFWCRKIYTDILGFMNWSKALFLCANVGIYAFMYLAFCILVGYLAINIGYACRERLRALVIVAVIILFLVIGKLGELFVLYLCSRAGYTNMDLATLPMKGLQTLFLPLHALYLVLSVACYALSVRWLQRHLNLD